MIKMYLIQLPSAKYQYTPLDLIQPKACVFCINTTKACVYFSSSVLIRVQSTGQHTQNISFVFCLLIRTYHKINLYYLSEVQYVLRRPSGSYINTRLCFWVRGKIQPWEGCIFPLTQKHRTCIYSICYNSRMDSKIEGW